MRIAECKSLKHQVPNKFYPRIAEISPHHHPLPSEERGRERGAIGHLDLEF